MNMKKLLAALFAMSFAAGVFAADAAPAPAEKPAAQASKPAAPAKKKHTKKKTKAAPMTTDEASKAAPAKQ